MSFTYAVASTQGVVVPPADLGDDPSLSGAASIEVVEAWGQPTRYTLRYGVRRDGDRLVPIDDDAVAPGAALAVLVEVAGDSHCLVRGPVHGHRAQVSRGLRDATFEVLGADSSIELDREERAAVHSGSETAIVSGVLQPHYDTVDLGGAAGASADSPTFSEDGRTLVQRGTDLGVVRRLAERYGRVFFERTNPATLLRTAHYHDPVVGSPRARLVLHAEGVRPTIESFEVDLDIERPVSFVAAEVDPKTVAPWTSAPERDLLSGLGDHDLRALHADVRDSRHGAAVWSGHVAPASDDDTDLAQRVIGATRDAEFFVRARCSTSAHLLGAVVRVHDTVEVVGVGSRHSGLYYVTGVRHRIDPRNYVMELDLARNALSREAGLP